MSDSNLDAAREQRSQVLTGPVTRRGPGRLFRDLKVRPKLMVLHNIFFLVLTTVVYIALIPRFEDLVAGAQAREIALVKGLFAEGKPVPDVPGTRIYHYREGTAEALGIPQQIRRALDADGEVVLSSPGQPDILFRRDPSEGTYRRLILPTAYYRAAVNRARWILLAALGGVYVLAVLLLELVIMPRYVYRPLTLMLDADRATQAGDTSRELIPEPAIPGDEIGQIMKSRNATVWQLRKREEQLSHMLARLDTAKRSLAEQDRLASLGMLSASVAHELNTPLAVLRGSIEKLIETVVERPAQERLARMLRVTDRLRKISEGLLDFARVRKQEFEAVPVRRVIDEAWALVGIDERAGSIEFLNETGGDERVTGNPDRLVQVFVNLLRNALAAVKDRGMIRVFSLPFTREGRPWLSVSVEDNGPGIPAEVLPQIFEAFVTSRLDARGTGLGLAVAEGIVQQHGGTIEASNRPGGGARIEIRLPAAVEVRA